jgi:UPF0755 protein
MYRKIFIYATISVFFLFILFLIYSFNFRGSAVSGGYFTISRGDNFLQVAGNLKRQGYISSQIVFLYDVFVSGSYKKLKAGEYKIEQGQSYKVLLENFVKGQINPAKIMIAPGKTVKDIAGVLSSNRLFPKDDFLNSALNPNKELLKRFPFLSDLPEGEGLEGYLYPDTYFFDSSQSIEDIQSEFLTNFGKKFTPDLEEEIKKQGRTIFQIITMASILEKEVANYENKQIVSGILWKRIENNLFLQVDAPLLYFQTYSHGWLDTSIDSLYNTYKYGGLPKGPICNPSIESIKAAIYPQKTDYWFYLSTSENKIIFAKTLGQQLINKAKYLIQD